MSLADDVLEAAAGAVTEFAGINLPAGYLWANGQAVSRTAYPRLFAALTVSVAGTTANGSQTVSNVSADLTQLPISVVGSPICGPGIPTGATISAVTSTSITLSANATAAGTASALVIAPYGIGDGSSTFNVPDRRGRAGVGHDKMGAGSAAGRLTSAGGGVNGALLGAAGGAETHTLTTAEIPAHTHANTLTDGGHTHQYGEYGGSGSGSSPSAGTGYQAQISNQPTTSSQTGITINNASQGGGVAHTITQPSIVMNYIIKT